jgi:hypothetical protein
VVEWKTIRGLVWPHAFFSVQIRSIYPDTWFWHFNEYQLHKKGAVRWNCVHDSGKEDPNRKSCRIPTGLLVLIGSAFSSATFLSRKKFTCSKVEAIVLGYRISLIKYNWKQENTIICATIAPCLEFLLLLFYDSHKQYIKMIFPSFHLFRAKATHPRSNPL